MRLFTVGRLMCYVGRSPICVSHFPDRQGKYVASWLNRGHGPMWAFKWWRLRLFCGGRHL